MEKIELDTVRKFDCLNGLRCIPDGSVDLVLTDPPYNIGKESDWDCIENYQEWMLEVLKECHRVLKPAGVLYFFHSDMRQASRLMAALEDNTTFRLQSFCVWDKGDTFRKTSWCITNPDARHTLRSWFNTCEYVFHFFKGGEVEPSQTGLELIHSNPECFRELKDWYRSELTRLGIEERQVIETYRKNSGRSGAMFRHYFKDSQFLLPTAEVWRQAFEPWGFDFRGGGYEALRASYEALRASYEALRPTHIQDDLHNNVWREPAVPSTGRLHSCQKPLRVIRRMIRVSSRPGEVVLDPFMGSGTTAVAALQEGRHFLGFERSEKYWKVCQRRIADASADIFLPNNINEQ